MCLIYRHFNPGDSRWSLMILSLFPLFQEEEKGNRNSKGSRERSAAAFGMIGVMTMINACLLLPLWSEANKAVASPLLFLGRRAASM